MELYVHIPFCKQKCRYCDFASYAGCEHQMDEYVNSLLYEAENQSNRFHHPEVETVFLGGGTPSLLPSDLLHKLLGGLKELFDFSPDAEFTSEANPGTLTKAWLETARKCGVNRLSMGMQAKQTHLLQTLGRIHQYEDVAESVSLARNAGFTNISLDLMFGLPGQTMKDWTDSLEAALSLSPRHLSCYGLIPEENTPLKNDLDTGRLLLPDEDIERSMYDTAIRILSDHGFVQYEISNFALPGYECKHNLGYWQQIPYLGLGASASSMCMDTGSAAYTRETNPPLLHEYFAMIQQRDWSRREVLPISHEEAQFETLMLGLRTTKGIDEAAFMRMHGITLAECYGNKLNQLADRKLIVNTDGFWRLTRAGMDVQNAILVELMDD